ncbi:MAG: radical SAM protein [Clostridia bacterium]|nr:radical SAM protein [Clostridia bacterium]
MSATYVLGDNLYINLTNKCTCNCDFCIRHTTDHVAESDSLWYKGEEPAKEDVLAEILSRDLDIYDEIVFCGFGEPTCRLDDLIWISKQLKKKKIKNRIRVNTNGHASLYAGKDVAKMFKKCVDVVSVSLNAPDPVKYDNICHSKYGIGGFFGMLDFAASVKFYVPEVVFTIVDTMPKADQDACQELADSLKIPLRIRQYTENYDD